MISVIISFFHISNSKLIFNSSILKYLMSSPKQTIMKPNINRSIGEQQFT